MTSAFWTAAAKSAGEAPRPSCSIEACLGKGGFPERKAQPGKLSAKTSRTLAARARRRVGKASIRLKSRLRAGRRRTDPRAFRLRQQPGVAPARTPAGRDDSATDAAGASPGYARNLLLARDPRPLVRRNLTNAGPKHGRADLRLDRPAKGELPQRERGKQLAPDQAQRRQIREPPA